MKNPGKKLIGGIGLLLVALLLNPSSAFAASSFSNDLWRFANGNGLSIIDFNRGASGIWDNGELHVATDNYMFLDAQQRVTVSSALVLNNGPLLVTQIAQVGQLNSVGNVNVGGTVNGNVTGALTGNATTATALAANPTDCAANSFATTIAANGNLTCAAVADGGVANDITLTSTSSIGGTAGAAISGGSINLNTDSGTNTTVVGGGSTTGTIFIGTGAVNKTVTIGSLAGTSSITLLAGSGGINLTGELFASSAVNFSGATSLRVPIIAETLVDAADAGTSCAAANKGDIRIDVANKFFGCDGTNWQELTN